ncbi:MAG: type II toxin-antitoxin system RnlB family antitoxin [Tissierellia bacterium]|nr:type II toxin-antitoxin system RnlB family antitoxin [Tissierellia bacterium]
MSESYEIIKINSDLFPILIIGKTYHGLDDYISELEIELQKNKYKGKVIFDFLLSNGYNSTNRFMCSLFNGKFFNEIHYYQIDNRNEIITRNINKYFTENEHILSNGILSKKDIEIIKTTHNILYK